MIKPVGHRVLVEPLPVEEVSPGGIVLPKDKHHQQAQIKAKVIDVGPQAWKAFDDGEPWCKVGDIVYIAQYGGYTVDGEKHDQYRLLNDEDICAVEVTEDGCDA